MASRITSIKHGQARGRSASALVELLVGLGISGLVLTQICMIWYYSSRSFVAQLNYVDMDQTSQRTLDVLSREIRQTKGLISFATNKVVFRDYDGQTLAYVFAENQLMRIKGERKDVLLKECEAGSFAIYQRNPVEGAYDQYPAATPATCKLVDVRWKCKRRLLPSAPETKESMHSAKIVIRTTEP